MRICPGMLDTLLYEKGVPLLQSTVLVVIISVYPVPYAYSYSYSYCITVSLQLCMWVASTEWFQNVRVRLH